MLLALMRAYYAGQVLILDLEGFKTLLDNAELLDSIKIFGLGVSDLNA